MENQNLNLYIHTIKFEFTTVKVSYMKIKIRLTQKPLFASVEFHSQTNPKDFSLKNFIKVDQLLNGQTFSTLKKVSLNTLKTLF